MERLTHRNQYGVAQLSCKHTCSLLGTYKCNIDVCNSASAINKLADYEDAEEQGLLLKLPCGFNDTLYWIVNGNIRECWFKGIRCDKGYKPQIIARCLEGLLSKEVPIAKLENIGKTVFLTKEEAEKELERLNGNGEKL